MTPHQTTSISLHCEDPRLIGWLAGVIGPAPELRMAAPGGPAALALVHDRVTDAPGVVRALAGSGGRCAVLTDGADAGPLLAALRAGADGCVALEPDAEAMRSNLRAAARGTFQLPGTVWPQLLAADGMAAHAAAPVIGRALIDDVIENRRFDLVFQPIVDLRTGQVVALESLARFTAEPAQPPNVWLEQADAVGLRVPLEHELVRAALATLPAVPRDIRLNVNVSPEAAVDRGLAAVLDGADIERVMLEITDHHELDDYEPLAEALSDLRAGGLRLAVDDSGQGISSLQQIAQLRPSVMKLNRTLTRNIDHDATKRALAYALAGFATQIGASVVAEGLETLGELDTLRALGAPLGQGYLLARPRALRDLQLDHPLALPPSGDGATPEGQVPSLVLRGAAEHDFREAARAALRFLGGRSETMTFAVAHLDYARRRHTILEARGPLASELEPGVSAALEDTMCFHMAAGRGPRMCPDLTDSPLYERLPFARRLDVGAYLGVPMELPDGTRVGTLFALSRGPAAFGLDDLGLLNDVTKRLRSVLLAQTAGMDRGELLRLLRTLARTDELTGVLNAPGFAEDLGAELRRARHPGSYVRIEIEDLGSLRGHYGHTVADLVLKDIATALTVSVDKLDVVGRIAENRFAAVLLRHPHAEGVPRLMMSLGPRIQEAAARRDLTVSVRVGAVALDGVHTPEEAWELAAETAELLGAVPPAAA